MKHAESGSKPAINEACRGQLQASNQQGVLQAASGKQQKNVPRAVLLNRYQAHMIEEYEQVLKDSTTQPDTCSCQITDSLHLFMLSRAALLPAWHALTTLTHERQKGVACKSPSHLARLSFAQATPSRQSAKAPLQQTSSPEETNCSFLFPGHAHRGTRKEQVVFVWRTQEKGAILKGEVQIGQFEARRHHCLHAQDLNESCILINKVATHRGRSLPSQLTSFRPNQGLFGKSRMIKGGPYSVRRDERGDL
eukprot:1158360-Pelagomonas_calceolata.AAC.1